MGITEQHDVLTPTDSPSGFSPAPSPGSGSPTPSPALSVTAALVSVAAMSWIGVGWVRGLIPDWKYAAGAIVLCSLPAGLLYRLASKVIDRLPGGKR